MVKKSVNTKYIYSELSHEIIGAAFEVQNYIGPGKPEKTYQRVLAKELFLRGIKYSEQVQIDLIYKGEVVGKRRVDFLVEDKLILELKVASHIGNGEIAQLYEYLRLKKMKLGLIILFSQEVKIRRIVNLT